MQHNVLHFYLYALMKSSLHVICFLDSLNIDFLPDSIVLYITKIAFSDTIFY